MAETDTRGSDTEMAQESSITAAEKQPATKQTTRSNARQAVGQPVVYYNRGRKKKRRYTRGLREIQRLERGISRASTRVSGAVADGLSTYHKRSNQSSRRRRDGALRDALENWSEAFGDMVSEASWAPHDIAKRVNTRRIWRQVRPFVSSVLSPVSFFFR